MAIIAAMMLWPGPTSAQPFFFRRTQLSDSVQLNLADSATRSHLERVDAFVADQQWDEAVETLRRVMETNGNKLLAVSQSADARDDPDRDGCQRYLPVRQWCHLRLAMFAREAPDALRLYRDRVDPLARRWYEQGLRDRDEPLLKRVVDEMFCSSYGDDALFALGEIALERGQYARARDFWQRISPALRSARLQRRTDDEGKPIYTSGRPLWLEHRQFPQTEVKTLVGDGRTSWSGLAFPDTDLPLADVRARLALTSIMEGWQSRAAFELRLLAALHPDAKGKLNGKVVPYADALSALLAASQSWPAPQQSSGWPTFAGHVGRNKVAASRVDVTGRPVWSLELGSRLTVDKDALLEAGLGPRVAEEADALLSTHPIVVGGKLLWIDFAPPQRRFDFPHLVSRVRAYDLHSGKPAWPKFRSEEDEPDDGVVHQSEPFPLLLSDRRRWGVPRTTLTSDGRRVFARIGSPVTTRPREEVRPAHTSQLIGLDIERQGKLLWEPIEPEAGFAFEGSPVSDDSNLYVALRQSQAQPQLHVACYDIKTGQLRWRRWVCGAESPALGRAEELTHHLLTLKDGAVYVNTNLGCVAALEAATGEIRWLTRYPRAETDPSSGVQSPVHFQRDPAPCVFYRGIVLAAPSDCEFILALDSATGQLLWKASPDDVVHLLGVGGGNVIASGRRLWWFDVATGETVARFPMARRGEPQGFGRGTLAGNVVYWPTKSNIYVFDQRTAKPARQPIDLSARDLTGGNLIVAGGYLLVATADKIYAFNEKGPE